MIWLIMPIPWTLMKSEKGPRTHFFFKKQAFNLDLSKIFPTSHTNFIIFKNHYFKNTSQKVFYFMVIKLCKQYIFPSPLLSQIWWDWCRKIYNYGFVTKQKVLYGYFIHYTLLLLLLIKIFFGWCHFYSQILLGRQNVINLINALNVKQINLWWSTE